MFGAQGSSPFGTPSTPAFGTPSSTPAFGAPSSTPAFGIPSSTPAFGTTSTPLQVKKSECAKLRRMLEEEQRLRREREDEVQMANRKVETMSQRLAEARKDVEYAMVRADVAEDKWINVKRELQVAKEHVQLLRLENEETRQSILKQVEKKELELANALNAASIAERQIEEVSQELAYAKKDAEYAATRADLAEDQWIKTKRELQKERKLLQLLKLESDELRRSAMKQVEDKELELANVLDASEIAENEWIKVKKELQEKLEHVKLLKQECEETRQRSKRQVEVKELEFANALDAFATAASSSVAAEVESECAKLKRMLIEEGKNVQRLILEKDFVVKLAKRQLEEMHQEFLNVAATAELSSAPEGSVATSAPFATVTQSQSTPFGSSAPYPLFGSSGNTTFSTGSSMEDVFNSAPNTCSSHNGATASSASSVFSPMFRSSTASATSTFTSPMFGSSTASATSTFTSPMIGSSTASATSTFTSPMIGSSIASVTSTFSSPIFGSCPASSAPTFSPPMFGSSTASATLMFSSPMFGSSTASATLTDSSPLFGSCPASTVSSPLFGSSIAFGTSSFSSSMFGSCPAASSTFSSSMFGRKYVKVSGKRSAHEK